MGLAALPSASEGVLCVILVNTAVPFTIVRYLIRTILFIFGIHLDPAFTSSEEDPNSNRVAPSETYLDEFRSRTPAVRFDSVCNKAKEVHKEEEEKELEGQDCLVCLTGFEPDSEINHLCCGHVFHQSCLEQWVDYWNFTCPLCRTPLMGPDSEEDMHCNVW